MGVDFSSVFHQSDPKIREGAHAKRLDRRDCGQGYFDLAGFVMAPNNRKQAYIPTGAQTLLNPIGTAPGFILETEKDRLIITGRNPDPADRQGQKPGSHSKSHWPIGLRSLRWTGSGK